MTPVPTETGESRRVDMTTQGPRWRCPTCGRRFARKGQRHVCGSWTVEGHLEGKPAGVVQLFNAFCQLVEACGPFEFAPVRDQIGFQLNRIFAGVSLTDKQLAGYLDLARHVDSPRFHRISPYTKRLFVHRFVIRRPEELNDEFGGWVGEAYAVGCGTHLAER